MRRPSIGTAEDDKRTGLATASYLAKTYARYRIVHGQAPAPLVGHCSDLSIEAPPPYQHQCPDKSAVRPVIGVPSSLFDPERKSLHNPPRT